MNRKVSCSLCISLILLFYLLNSCRQAVITHEVSAYPNINDYPAYRGTYTVPFEDGYIYKDNENVIILLKFCRPNSLFAYDAYARLHIYISGIKRNVNGESKFNEKVVYFIRRPKPYLDGYMHSKDINLTALSNNTFRISGNLVSEKVIGHDVSYKVESSFVDLPLIQVNSINELYENNDNNFRQIFKGVMENEKPEAAVP